MFNKLFFRKWCRLWDNVEKYGTARQATDGNITRLMRFACWITKATDTHSEYAILSGFPRWQWLLERSLMLRYAYVACLVHCRQVRVGQPEKWDALLPFRSNNGNANAPQCYVTLALCIMSQQTFRTAGNTTLRLYLTKGLCFAPKHLTITPTAIQRRTKGRWLGSSNPPPQKFRRPPKVVLNSTRLWKLLKI